MKIFRISAILSLIELRRVDPIIPSTRQNCFFHYMCCSPANWRVDFKNGLLLKVSFKTKINTKAFQLTKTKGGKNQ